MIQENKLTSLIKKITSAQFAEYVASMNTRALVVWFSLQTAETQAQIMFMQAQTNKLIDKYHDISKVLELTRENRDYIAFCLNIKICKHISDNTVSHIVLEPQKLGYKESMICNNIDIVESIIFESISIGNKNSKWDNVMQEFFRRLDKKFLKGNDKLKKDYRKIMTLTYFRDMSLKYLFTKSKRLEEYLTKADINNIAEQKLAEALSNDEEVKFKVADDIFTSRFD